MPVAPSWFLGGSSDERDGGASRLRSWIPGLRVAFGRGVLVADSYMDPGNWATDIAAGSHHALYAAFSRLCGLPRLSQATARLANRLITAS